MSLADNANEYLVLARKYRPKQLSEVIGQDVLVQTLRHAFERGRVPHAFLLTGIRGVGKTSTARIIARSLLCVGADGTRTTPTVSPCGVCEQCRAIAEDRHMDVMEMDAASNTGVDDIREIIDTVKYLPTSGRLKVFIIDEVHMLSKNAFNALLKTLEEPPPYVMFIFATTEVRKIPITILSRCMRFDLARVEADVLGAHLTRIAEAEKVQVEAGAIELIANAAEGSVRDALSLLDQAIAHCGGHAIGSNGEGGVVDEARVRAMLGLVSRAGVFALFEHVAGGDIKTAIGDLRTLYRAGADPVMILHDLLEITHLVTQMKLVPEQVSGNTLPGEERKRGAALAEALPFPFLARAWQMLLKGVEEVKAARSTIMAAEMVIIRLAYVSDLPTPGDLIRDLRNQADSSSAPQQGSTVSAPATVTASAEVKKILAQDSYVASTPAVQQAPLMQMSAPVAAQPVGVVPSASLADFAAMVALFEQHEEFILYNQLHQVRPVSFDAKARKVEFRLHDEAPERFVNRVSDCMQRFTGERWFVVVSSSEGETSLRESKDAAFADMADKAVQDPRVQAVLKNFPGARVTNVRMASDDEINEAASAAESK